MASIMQHIAVAHMVNSNVLHLEGKALEEFILGSVAPDSQCKVNNKAPNADRQKLHFTNCNTSGEEDRHNFEQYSPDLKMFIDKYAEKLSNPFMLGYFVHLATDKYYFKEFVPKKVTEHLQEIKPGAKDYSELTNKEYLSWYKPRFYGIFDDGDLLLPSLALGLENLPDFSKFMDYESPIEELDSESLHNLLVKLNQKYRDLQNQKNWEKAINPNRIVSPKEQFDFLEGATDYITDILSNLNITLENTPSSCPKL